MENQAFLFSFLHVLADNLYQGVMAIDEHGIIRVFNYFCGSLLKTRVPDALGRKFGEIIPNSRLDNVVKDKRTTPQNYFLFLNENKLRITQFPLWEQGKLFGAIEFWENNSEVEQLTCSLKKALEQNRLLDNILNTAFEDIGAVDKEGRVTYLNKNTAVKLGVEREAAWGKIMREIRQDCLMEKVARTGDPQMGKLWRVNNNYVPVMVLPLIENNEITGAVCKSVFRDLNEAKEFIKNMQFTKETDAQKKKNDFNSGAEYTFDDLIGAAPALQAVKNLALRAANSGAIILITGESGTGKELFAHAIHAASARRNMPFVKVNCASIPETLLESELFGYEDGAFTGARKGGKPGKFELANGGTIFLDEIGDMSLATQAKLLRFLQEGEIEKVGGTRAGKVDVRVIAATNKDLKNKVERGEFREDLYYRLEVILIRIPPLRERIEDIYLLTRHFIARLRSKNSKEVQSLAPDLEKALLSYPWPGNVRELANVLEGAVCLAEGETLKITDLPPHFRERLKINMANISLTPPRPLGLPAQSAQSNQSKRPKPVIIECAPEPVTSSLGEAVSEAEKNTIQKVLELTQGNKRRAAYMLGIARSTFYEKLRKYNLA